jgi:hypothetical protein
MKNQPFTYQQARDNETALWDLRGRVLMASCAARFMIENEEKPNLDADDVAFLGREIESVLNEIYAFADRALYGFIEYGHDVRIATKEAVCTELTLKAAIDEKDAEIERLKMQLKSQQKPAVVPISGKKTTVRNSKAKTAAGV